MIGEIWFRQQVVIWINSILHQSGWKNRFAPEESWILEGEGTDLDALLPIETIQRSIYVVRGQRVMLDSELAILHGVETRTLVRAAKGWSPLDQRLATLEDASRLHGDRLDAIETTLAAMERQHPSVNITVQGDMIGNTLSLGAFLDTLGAKASQLGFDAADDARFQGALQDARVNPPHTALGRAALPTLKRMLQSVAEHAGGAVVEHGVLAQLGRFLGQAFHRFPAPREMTITCRRVD